MFRQRQRKDPGVAPKLPSTFRASLTEVSVPDISLYPQQIHQLREHQKRLFDAVKAFQLALDKDEPEVKTDYPASLKPWSVLSELLVQRESILIKLGQYLKNVLSNKHPLLFNLSKLDTRSIAVPDWSSSYLDALQKELDALIRGICSVTVDLRYPRSQFFVDNIPELVAVISSINLPVVSFSRYLDEDRLSPLDEMDASRSTFSSDASPFASARSSARLSRFSAQSPEFKSAPSLLLVTLREAHQKLEQLMTGSLAPVLVSLLSFGTGEVPSVELSYMIQDASDFWQLMHQVTQWSAQIIEAPSSFNLFTDSLKELPEQRISEDIITPFYSTMRKDLRSVIDTWNREINQLAFNLNKLLDAESFELLKIKTGFFVKKLSESYFYERNELIHKYLQDVFGTLGRVELFGAQLFMKDNCDVDVRIILNKKGGMLDEIVRALVTRLKQKNPHGNYTPEAKEYYLSHEMGSYRVINIKVLAGPSHSDFIDISVFPDNYYESRQYVSFASASMDLGNGRLYCQHDFMRDILNNEFSIRGEISLFENPLSRKIHILKSLIRSLFVPALYLGKSLLLNGNATVKNIYDTEIDYEANLLAHPDLRDELKILLQRHFDQDTWSPAFLNRTANIIRFFQKIGCRLIVTKKDQQFELALGPEPLKIIQLKSVGAQVEKGEKGSLFIDISPQLAACFNPSPYAQQLMLGLFGSAMKHSPTNVDKPKTYLSAALLPTM